MLATFRNPRRVWSQWQGLSALEKRILVRAFFLLPLTSIGLRLLSVSRIRDLLEPRRGAGTVDAEAVAVARRVVKMVRIAANHGPISCSCLPRALTAQWFLRDFGIPSQVRFGAATGKPQFEAHAWIECAGQTFDLTGEDVDQFVPFDHPLVGGPR